MTSTAPTGSERSIESIAQRDEFFAELSELRTGLEEALAKAIEAFGRATTAGLALGGKRDLRAAAETAEAVLLRYPAIEMRRRGAQTIPAYHAYVLDPAARYLVSSLSDKLHMAHVYASDSGRWAWSERESLDRYWSGAVRPALETAISLLRAIPLLELGAAAGTTTGAATVEDSVKARTAAAVRGLPVE